MSDPTRSERFPDDDRDLKDEDTQSDTPGPRDTASPRTQQDAGLEGGQAAADRGERVGADDEE